jgi:hypothetical protein
MNSFSFSCVGTHRITFGPVSFLEFNIKLPMKWIFCGTRLYGANKIVLSTYVVPGNIFTRGDTTAEQPYNRGWEDARLRAHFKYPDARLRAHFKYPDVN